MTDKPTPDSAPKRNHVKWAQKTQSPAQSQGTLLLITTLLIFVVSGVLMVLLRLPKTPRTPYLVSIPLTPYDLATIPPPAWAEQDASRLCNLFPESSETAATALIRDKFRQKLEAIRQGRLERGVDPLKNGRPFILHIVGYAAVVKKEVNVLPVDIDDEFRNAIRLDEILTALAACPTPNKLLILDLARPRANPFTGPFVEDISRTIHETLIKKGPNIPCAVLTTCSPNEFSVTGSATRSSAMAFYCAEGIRGAADASPRDGHVTVSELADYVQVKVSRWARECGGASQVPQLYATTAQKAIKLNLDAVAPPTEDALPISFEYDKAETSKLWERFAPLPPSPATFAWAAAAIRAERIFAATAKSADPQLLQNLQRHWPSPPTNLAANSSVASLRSITPPVAPPAAAGMPPAPDPIPIASQLWAQYLQATSVDAAKPDEIRPPPTNDPVFKSLTDRQIAKVIWQTTVDSVTPLTPKQYLLTEKALPQSIMMGTELFTELVLVRRIVEESTAQVLKYDEGKQALQILLQLEDVANHVIVEAQDSLPRFAETLSKLTSEKHRLEGELFVQLQKSLRETQKLDQQLRLLHGQFQAVLEQVRTFREARVLANETRRYAVATAYAAAEYDEPPVEGAWGRLVEAAKQLVEVVDVPSTTPIPDNLAERVRRGKVALAEVQKLYEPATIETLVKSATSCSAEDLRRLHAALATPLVRPLERRQLWDELHIAEGRHHMAFRKRWDLTGERTIGTPEQSRPQQQRHKDRAAVTLALLALAGHPDAELLKREFQNLQNTDSSETWRPWETKVRTAWTTQRDDLTKRWADAKQWAAIERLMLVSPMELIPIGFKEAKEGIGAIVAGVRAAKLRQEADQRARRIWLADYYREIGSLRKNVQGPSALYEKAANALDQSQPN